MKSPIGILFYNKKGNLIAANQLANDIEGIPKSEDVSINLFDNPDNFYRWCVFRTYN